MIFPGFLSKPKMATDSILISTADGVATITLNRPDVLNSFNSEMAAALQAAITGVAGDDSVRAVLLTGAGRAFCAGQDLAEAMPKEGVLPDLGDFVRTTWNPIVLAIRTLEKPVVCAVNGTAAGAGAGFGRRRIGTRSAAHKSANWAITARSFCRSPRT